MRSDQIKATLDTNVLASGTVRPDSVPGELLRRWLDGAFDLIVSSVVMAELRTTLVAPYFQRRLTNEEREAAVAGIERVATTVAVSVVVSGAATHPEDDLILATAVSGQADYLVTGDRPLRRLDAFRGVTILTPREFLDLLIAREQADET